MPNPTFQPRQDRFADRFSDVLRAIAVTAFLIHAHAVGAVLPSGPEIAVSVNGQLHSQNDELADLGEMLVGKPNTVRLQIVNSGDATLHVTSIRFGGNDGADIQLSDPDDSFSVSPTALARGRGRSVDLVFTPSHEGTELGVMSIANDSATPIFKLRFRATGVVRPILQLSVNGQVIDNGGTFDFGSISQAQARSGTNIHSLELRNIGNQNLSILGRTTTGKFGVDSLTFPNSTFTLAPDQTRVSSVSFGVFGDIIGPGLKEGDLTINTNEIQSPFTLHLKVNVLGPRIDIRFNDVSALSTGGHDFGSVFVGQTASVTLTIASIGSETLTGRLAIGSPTNTQDFQLGAPNLNFSLAPGEIFTSPLTVTPSALGSVTAFLTVESNAGSFSLQLVANGIEPSQTPPDNGSIGNPSPPVTNQPTAPDDAAASTTGDSGNTLPNENKDDLNRLASPGANEAAAPESDSDGAVVSVAPPGVCGFGSAAMLPMMAVALCGMRRKMG
jgi:hypothetical protein